MCFVIYYYRNYVMIQIPDLYLNSIFNIEMYNQPLLLGQYRTRSSRIDRVANVANPLFQWRCENIAQQSSCRRGTYRHATLAETPACNAIIAL
jgi:hypothetical protein